MPSTAQAKPGTLSDREIKDMCADGSLIVENFEPKNIKQACYELRADTICYEPPNTKRIEISPTEYILIKPKQLKVVITKERLTLPNNIIGKVLTKGKLFSIGLLPVNTYADPGFEGRLGIVLYNLSNDYIKIKPGDSIAKIEFSRLASHVESPYKGQHGYQTEIWPIPIEMILSEEEIKKDSRIKRPHEEIELAYGKDIGKVLRRIYDFEGKLVLASLLYFIATLLLVAITLGTDWMSPIVNVSLGVFSNIIMSIIIWFATNLRRR